MCSTRRPAPRVARDRHGQLPRRHLSSPPTPSSTTPLTSPPGSTWVDSLLIEFNHQPLIYLPSDLDFPDGAVINNRLETAWQRMRVLMSETESKIWRMASSGGDQNRRKEKKVRRPMDPSRTGRVRSGSSNQICNTRLDPPRFLFKRSGLVPPNLGSARPVPTSNLNPISQVHHQIKMVDMIIKFM